MEIKEYLDIVNEHGEPTGETVLRSVAHGKGVPHRTSHVWLLRNKEIEDGSPDSNSRIEILLQKRAAHKSFPDCYDISSAGHIPAGDDFVASALRELKEELGVTADAADLICCGDRYIVWDDVFFGQPYHDRQYTRVFLIWIDMDEDRFTLQEEEVQSVLWMDLEECIRGVIHGFFENCIALEELLMVKRTAYGMDYLYDPEKCPCPRGGKVGCPRYRKCEACIAFHRTEGNPPHTACEKAASEGTRIISVEQMRRSDAYTIEHLVPGRELMYRAAQGVYDAYDGWSGKKIAILAGGGNNGGDGYALAGILKKQGTDSVIYKVSDKMSDDGRFYSGIAADLGVLITDFDENTDLSAYDVIVDCILGTGFRGEVRGRAAEAVRAINESGAYVISVDINSGMNGDTGEAVLAVRSDLTVSIGYYKQGLFRGQAAEYIGSLTNVDIGIVLV